MNPNLLVHENPGNEYINLQGGGRKISEPLDKMLTKKRKSCHFHQLN